MSAKPDIDKLALEYVLKRTSGKRPRSLTAAQQNIKLRMIRTWGYKQTKAAIDKYMQTAALMGL